MIKYKIYRKDNYIVVVDSSTSETFYGHIKNVMIDKSNVNKSIYRFFNIKDFKEKTALTIDQILKEDGSNYTTEEFDTFYTQNTGNFNGGGSAPTDADLQAVTDLGSVTTNSITANSFITTGGLATQFTKANGSLDSTKYAEFYKTLQRTAIYFSGKDIEWFGDSYTVGSGASTTAKRFTSLVSGALGATEVNHGVAGTTIQKRAPIDYMASPNMVDNVVNIPTKTTSKAMLVFAFGLNDMGQTAPAYSTANYKTDYQFVLDNAFSKGWLPSQILIIPAYYIGSAGYTAYATITGNAAPTQARHLAFIQAAKEVSESNSTMYFDIYQDQLKNNTTLLVADNIHPNDAGYAYIASDILQYLGQGQFGSSPFALSGSDIKPIDTTYRVYLGSTSAAGAVTPNGRLNLGGQYNTTANDPANAKLVIADGGGTNVYGASVSATNGLEIFGGLTGANKITLFGNTFTSGKGTFLGNVELSATASPTITLIQNSTGGFGGLFSQNSVGSLAGFRQNGTGVGLHGAFTGQGICGSTQGIGVISNFDTTSGGIGEVVLMQGGTNSPNYLKITQNRVEVTLPIKLKGYTVSTLPTGSIGDTAYVTDALTPAYLTIVVGGGAVVSPVFYDGVSWKAH